MFRLSVVALLAASLAPSADPPKGETKEGLYFPVAVGTKWVYKVTDGGQDGEMAEAVTKVEEKDGAFLVTVDREPGKGRATTMYEVSAKGVSRLPSGGRGAEEPLPLLVAGAKAGDTWVSQQERTGAADQTRVTYTMRGEEEVEVPAGRFKAVKVESAVDAGGGRTAKNVYWHARGVGVVKLATTGAGAERTHELKAFTPGREEKKGEPKKDR